MQDQNSFLTNVALSLHHRSKYAHHHLSMAQFLLSMRCRLTSIITHLSPLCSRGLKIHTHLAGKPYPKYNRGSPPPQLRQASASLTGSRGISSDPLTPPQRLSRTVLVARNFRRHPLSAGSSTLPPLPFFLSPNSWAHVKSCFTMHLARYVSRAVCYETLDCIVPGLCPSHTHPYHSVDYLCHAAQHPLPLLPATVFTDSVIYIYCDSTGYSLSTCCIVCVLI